MQDSNEQVQQLLDELIASGEETGLQVAAYHQGEQIVDAWSGLADRATGRPVTGETLFNVFSCGKGVLATLIHILTEAGQVDYNAPVSAYWPEFAVNGKESITVRHVLTHTAGIPQMPDGADAALCCDWDRMCSAIAQLTPLWQPGTNYSYHARTFGWVLGEVAQRATRTSFNELVKKHITEPLGITGMYFGIPDEVEPLMATLEDAPQPTVQLVGSLAKVFPATVPATGAFFNRPDIRRACMPSSAGSMNARSLARHYASLAGGVDGVQLLPPSRVKQATLVQVDSVDALSGAPALRGLGYILGRPLTPMGGRPSVFGHSGTGGAIGFADPDYQFAFALTKTRIVAAMPGADAASRVARQLRSILGIPEN